MSTTVLSITRCSLSSLELLTFGEEDNEEEDKEEEAVLLLGSRSKKECSWLKDVCSLLSCELLFRCLALLVVVRL